MMAKEKCRKITERDNVFEKECSSSTKNIACVEKFLKQIDSKLSFDDETMYRLMVSCTEAVNNAIIHGNKSDPNKKVVIRCTVEKKILTIRVKDEGNGFNTKKLKNPTDTENLLKENGRGVFLMRTLMDKVKFKRLKSGSIVEMKMKIK
jgi:serine/threonine-protein kinase RsbW